MKLKHALPKQAIDAIDFVSADAGESGWVVYLKDGWSFDPLANDGTRFVPYDDPSEVNGFVVYEVAA
jgi:hypothetical protein